MPKFENKNECSGPTLNRVSKTLLGVYKNWMDIKEGGVRTTKLTESTKKINILNPAKAKL